MKNSVRLRFRIRTILLITAVVAAIVTIVPIALKRYRVNVALDTVIEKGRAAVNSPEWQDLAIDEPRALGRLLQVLKSQDESEVRRINAAYAIVAFENSSSIREQALPQLVAVVADPQSAWLGPNVLHMLSRWIPAAGLADDQRKQIYERAARALEHREYSLFIDWLQVLVAIGGQDELQLIDRYFSTLCPADKATACNLLTRQLSEEMLVAAERWIYDPEGAEYALQLDVLSLTKGGRSALLRFALDSTQPSTLRSKALEQLRHTTAGLDLLEGVFANQSQANELSKLMEVDCQTICEAERAAILNAKYGDEFWGELIDGTDLNYFLTPASPNVKPASSEQQARDQKNALQKSQLSIDLLRRLSGRKEIAAQADWQAWLCEGQKPAELRLILEVVMEHPELLGLSTVLRRMVPYHLAEIPGDCLPLYKQMLALENPTLRYWACKALLHFSDDPVAIDVAIDLIEKDKPRQSSQSLGWRSGSIPLLSERFGVNYFWDTDAWREWAKSRRSKDTSR